MRRTKRDVQVARGMQQERADHDRGKAAHLGHHLRPRLRLLRAWGNIYADKVFYPLCTYMGHKYQGDIREKLLWQGETAHQRELEYVCSPPPPMEKNDLQQFDQRVHVLLKQNFERQWTGITMSSSNF